MSTEQATDTPAPGKCPACLCSEIWFFTEGDELIFKCNATYYFSSDGKWHQEMSNEHQCTRAFDVAVALRAERDGAREYIRTLGRRFKELSDEHAETSEHNTRMAQQVNILAARLARVTEACKPFIDCLSDYVDDISDDVFIYAEEGDQHAINIGHLRVLTAALAAPDGGQGATTGCGYCDDHNPRLKLVSGTGKFLGWYHDVDGVAQRCTGALAASVDAPAEHKGFWVTTPDGNTMHVHGDPNMSEETLSALQHMMELAVKQYNAAPPRGPKETK